MHPLTRKCFYSFSVHSSAHLASDGNSLLRIDSFELVVSVNQFSIFF